MSKKLPVLSCQTYSSHSLLLQHIFDNNMLAIRRVYCVPYFSVRFFCEYKSVHSMSTARAMISRIANSQLICWFDETTVRTFLTAVRLEQIISADGRAFAAARLSVTISNMNGTVAYISCISVHVGSIRPNPSVCCALRFFSLCIELSLKPVV